MEEHDGQKNFFLHYRGTRQKKQKTWTQGLTSDHRHKKMMMQLTMCAPHNVHVHQTKLG